MRLFEHIVLALAVSDEIDGLAERHDEDKVTAGTVFMSATTRLNLRG